MLKYGKGDCVVLAYPNDISYKGEEVEIIRIISENNKYYEVRILSEDTTHIAAEKQLKPLDDALTLVSWKDCAWSPHAK